MVTRKKTNTSDDDEDDGNLGDDETEQYEVENFSRKRKRRMKVYNSRKRKKRMSMVPCSSDEELVSSSPQISYPRIYSEEKGVYSMFETPNVKGFGFQLPNDTTNAVCYRFNEVLTISTPSSSNESRFPISLDTHDFHRKNETSPINCMNCKIKTRNSLFMHKRTGHQVFCYCCALMWWRSNEKCPVCKKKILQVIKISIA